MRTKALFILLLVAIFAIGCGAPSVEELVTVNSAVEVSKAEFIGTVEDSNVTVELDYLVKNTGDEPLTVLPVVIPSISEVSVNNLNISVDDKSCTLEGENNISVKLPYELASDKEMKFKISYDLSGISIPEQGEANTWRLIVPSIGNSTMASGKDKFTVELNVPGGIALKSSVPIGLNAVSNEKIQGGLESAPSIIILDVQGL